MVYNQTDSSAMQEIPMSYKRTSFVRMSMDFLNARKLALGCTLLQKQYLV